MCKRLFAQLIIVTMLLSGCAAAIIGGGVVTIATLHDRRSPGTVIDDKNIQLSIKRNYLTDKTIFNNSHINVTVYNGVVLLTGEAKNQQVINTAVAKARQFVKVRRVESDVIVGKNSTLLSRSNDYVITTKVRAAMLGIKNPKFDTTLVKVTTERGNVYLMGLFKRTEAAAATDRARRVSGVKAVNKLFEYVD